MVKINKNKIVISLSPELSILWVIEWDVLVKTQRVEIWLDAEESDLSHS